jgi:hypothetical protein
VVVIRGCLGYALGAVWQLVVSGGWWWSDVANIAAVTSDDNGRDVGVRGFELMHLIRSERVDSAVDG